MAEWLGWYGYGVEGSPDIEVGEGSVEDIVSHHKDVHAAIRRHGMPIKHRAEVNLAARSKTGGFQVTWMYTNFAGGDLNSTKLDYYVVLHDTDDHAFAGSNTEGQGKGKSALSLEYGHRNTRSKKDVPGAWILHDAAGLPHGK